ncbi:MAG: NAD-dependent nucleoside diphosphate-sugar epimerase/dehydratase [Candidatus Poribacteria bacterium]|nr:MAG: NAD-dependent nucleoside diphosphate-sugar epimerase/dehydratase [Candidatus Poribacteria bacterium]
MTVFLTGASGYVGSYVARELLQRGHRVRALVRPESEWKLRVDPEAIEIVHGDITAPESLRGTIEGCEVVIHLVGIIEEIPDQGITFERIHLQGALNVLEEAKRSGVRRFVLMSANGVKPREEAVSGYQWTKYEAEQAVKASGLEYVIFRPSLIFGEPGPGQPEFTTGLIEDLFSIPLIPLPLFCRGFPLGKMLLALFSCIPSVREYISREGTDVEMQPVAVENVAEGFAKAVDRENVVNRTYEVGGPDRVRWGVLLDIVAEAAGIRPRWKMPLPELLIRPVLALPISLPLTRDKLEMLLEGNVCDPEPFFRDFEIHPIPFTVENLGFLRTWKARNERR